MVCSHTPRFSYGGPKTAVPHAPYVLCMARTDRGDPGVAGRVGIPGYGTGGYTGVVHPATALKGGTQNQRSGPRKPLLGGWSGWVLGAGIPFAPGPLGPPLPAVGPASLSQVSSPSNTRLLANKGEIPSHFLRT